MTIRTDDLDSFLLNHDLILHENPEKKIVENLIIIEFDIFFYKKGREGQKILHG